MSLNFLGFWGSVGLLLGHNGSQSLHEQKDSAAAGSSGRKAEACPLLVLEACAERKSSHTISIRNGKTTPECEQWFLQLVNLRIIFPPPTPVSVDFTFMKVLEIAVGAVFATTRFSLVRISIPDLVGDGKSLVRNSGGWGVKIGSS